MRSFELIELIKVLNGYGYNNKKLSDIVNMDDKAFSDFLKWERMLLFKDFYYMSEDALKRFRRLVDEKH